MYFSTGSTYPALATWLLVLTMLTMLDPTTAVCTKNGVVKSDGRVDCDSGCQNAEISGCYQVSCGGSGGTCNGATIDFTGAVAVDDPLTPWDESGDAGEKTLHCHGFGNCQGVTVTNADWLRCSGFQGTCDDITAINLGRRSCSGDTCSNIELLIVDNAGGGGDPHFQGWNGTKYDYHGQCDLVMINAPKVFDGKGLLVHARTTKRYQYSFIESIAVQMGDHILQVNSWGKYFLNGVEGGDLKAFSFEFRVTHQQPDERRHVFEVSLGESREKLILKTNKDIVSFSLENASSDDFQDSVGMMGNFGSGAMLARDGVTVLEDDPKAFGQEWQVRKEEPRLFQEAERYPQFPQHCIHPDAVDGRRRLGSSIALKAAEQACAHWTKHQKECIYDVMATGDLELARAGSLF